MSEQDSQNQHETESPYLGTDAICQRYNISFRQASRLCKDGKNGVKLKGIKPGQNWLTTQAWMEAFEAALQEAQQATPTPKD